ncbi:hypothetical protein VMCG_06990 [Cytospora schulzeri]|uniref:Uncharacterized protein n=1 Tax=Cytospora schulzeri TaxID=448051 RepID=A0A423W414_9PEZI|nr:hypothetical protein VMCG_06990 [Valsa malicola]
MNDSGQPPNSGLNAEEAEVEGAYQLANTITIGHLTRRLEVDPAADLSSILEQQAASYTEFRNSLAQEARQRIAVATATEQDESSGVEPQDVLVDDDDVEIIHPLDDQVMVFTGLLDPPSRDAVVTALIPKLHQAMKMGENLWSLHGTCVLGLGQSMVVKIGTCLNPDGIANLKYINAQVPQIPAPMFLGSMSSRQRTYIFMSRGEGVTLESVWPQLSVAGKLSAQRQLNDIFHVLRAKGNDQGSMRIGGFTSGICRDTRRQQRTCEKIASEADFNDFLCHESRRTQTPWIRMIRSFMGDDHKLVMTHADLHPRNIMVKCDAPTDRDGLQAEEDGRIDSIQITSLIDWEMSGWYPEYWEFVKALNTVDLRGPLADWCDYLPTEAIGKWPIEYSMDLLISRWLG